RKGSNEDDRRDPPNDRSENPEAGLFQGLPACRERQDSDGDGGRRRRFELEPEARVKGDEDGEPHAEATRPGGEWSAGKKPPSRRCRDTHESIPTLQPCPR